MNPVRTQRAGCGLKHHIKGLGKLALLIGFGLILLGGVPARAATVDRIAIAYSKDSVPFHFSDEQGRPAGIMIDLWRLWSKKTKIAVDFIPADWDETLKMVGAGKADVHAGLFFTEERDRYLDYGEKLTKTDTHVFIHTTLPQVSEVKDLAPYQVGVLAGDYVETYLKQRLSDANVQPFDDYHSIIEALGNGTLRVFAADTPTGLFHLKKSGLLPEFSFVSEKPLYSNDFFFASAQGNQELIQVVNQGMALITADEKREINRRWVASGESKGKSIIISIDRAYEPLTFVNSLGKPSGLFVDIWRAWSQKTGRKIRFRATNWAETVGGLIAGEADIHSGLSLSEDRAEWIAFSTKLFHTFTRIYHRANEPQPTAIDGYASSDVGAMFGSFQEAEFRKTYPDIPVRSYATNQKLIDALLGGDVKAVVQEAPLMHAAIDRLGLHGDIEERSEKLFPATIHAGVLKENSRLLEEINDGLAALDRNALAEIETRWIPDSEDRFYRTATGAIDLSPDEASWLADHPVLRIAPNPDFVPIEFFDEQGRYQGLAADFINLAAERLGVQLEAIQKENWTQALDAVRIGEADLIVNSPTDDFRKEFLFTEPFFGFHNAIITRGEIKGLVRLEDLSGKQVLLVKGWPAIHIVRDQYPEIKVVEVESTLDVLSMVSLKQYDYGYAYFPTATHLIEEHGLTGLRVAGIDGELTSGAVMVGKDAGMLHRLMDKALSSITKSERRAIKQRRIPGLSSFESMLPKRVALNKDERLWLAKHPVVRVAMDPGWAPVEFADDQGRFHGISMDYLQHLGRLLGIRFEIAEGLTWPQAIAAAENGTIDLLPSVARTSDREARHLFSAPYLSMPINIFARDDVTYIGNLDALNGKRVAVIEGYAIHDWLKGKHPEIKLVPAKSVREALRMVAGGETYAFVGNVVTTSYYITKMRLNQIRVAGETPYENAQSMAVGKDLPLLAGILQKGLDAITKSEREAIFNRWVSVKYEHGFDYSLLWKAGIPAFLVLLFLLYWNRRLGGEIAQRKAAEERFVSLIEAAPDAMVIVGANGRITLVNTQTERLFGYERRELLGQPMEILLPEVQRDSHVELRNVYIADPSVRAMGSGLDLKAQDKKGRVFPVDISLSPLETPEGLVVVTSIRDITERKEAEEALALAEEQNRLVLSSVGEGIVGVDTRGDVTFVNPSALAILGFKADELIGRSIHRMIQHSNSDGTAYDNATSPIRAAYTQGDSHHITDEVLWRKDGGHFFAAYKSTPIQKGEEVIGAVVTFSDVSKRKQMEDELMQHVKGLERFSSLSVGREMTMIDLKKEVNRMCRELGLDPKYKIVSEESV
jgi:PAS domain S-box-containing protein